MIGAFIELGKPRITFMVALTAALGYWLGGGRDKAALAWLMAGVSLSSAAAGALNQWLERDLDALMRRTASRPLPSGRLYPGQALVFGLTLSAAGPLVLWLTVGALAAAISAGTIALYVLGYTPLKRLTPQSTWIGAIAGATSPLIGWAAAQGTLALGGWSLFAIQFVWQIPHFLALFWLYREDYARAGFKVMPVVDPGGKATALQISLHSFALLLASVFPFVAGAAGPAYGWAALLAGTAFLALGVKASLTLSIPDARRLFRASLLYLPLVFGMLVLG